MITTNYERQKEAGAPMPFALGEGNGQRERDALAEWEASKARERELNKLSAAQNALLQFGTTEDIEAAAPAVAKIAAKAMRRRA